MEVCNIGIVLIAILLLLITSVTLIIICWFWVCGNDGKVFGKSKEALDSPRDNEYAEIHVPPDNPIKHASDSTQDIYNQYQEIPDIPMAMRPTKNELYTVSMCSDTCLCKGACNCNAMNTGGIYQQATKTFEIDLESENIM